MADQTARPLFDYHLLLGITVALVGIGLVMVLSASMATSGRDSGTVWGVFIRQAAMVVLGFIGFWLVLKFRIRTIKAIATPLMLLSLVALVAVLILGTGMEEWGAQQWIRVGGVGIQPSELAKVALALWGAKVLSDRLRTARTLGELYSLFGAGALATLLLVMIQRDLGMVVVISLIALSLVVCTGIPGRYILGLAGAAVACFIGLILFEGFRSQRIATYVDTFFLNYTDTQGPGYQMYQGTLSLADGSFTGVGLGQSRAKWFYLPEANNDFIFAIIGEELGFIGATLVIVLYGLLGWVGLRIAMKQVDPFLRLLSATLTTSVVVSAFINIGYVVGWLPVTGIQLPLISAGGTSAVITIGTMGLLAACARHEPEAISAMQTSGRPVMDRFFRIPEPLPYREKSVRDGRSRAYREPQRFGKPVTRGEDETRPRKGGGTGVDLDRPRPERRRTGDRNRGSEQPRGRGRSGSDRRRR